MAKRIKLTRGKWAIVDDADYEWLKQWKWRASGKITKLYAVRSVSVHELYNRRSIGMHNVIMNSMNVDHINGDPLDNKRSNLRLATHKQNGWNRLKYTTRAGTKTSSQYKGVSWDKAENKWASHIRKDGKLIKLGRFVDEIEAARAYDRMALKLFGEFAHLNFPRSDYEGQVA